MHEAWGGEYGHGRYFNEQVGVPAIANAGVKVLKPWGHIGFRLWLLYWEGWRDPSQHATAGRHQ
jgi:menaquinone-9 beta-reductase